MSDKIVTYMAGPMDDVSIEVSRDWRDWLTEELKKVEIQTLNPITKHGDDYGKFRQRFSMWGKYGNVDAIRSKVSTEIIPPDVEMVRKCDFVTLYIPTEGHELCGSYGEMTLGFVLGLLTCPKCGYKWERKPIYIVTKRKLKPLNVPKWAVGCSTRIFSNWKKYLQYIRKRYGKNK